jgi:uncharacterized protein (TIGR01777 family)
MNIAVTGGTGRIGSALVARLRERGNDVTLLSRSADRGVEWHPQEEPAPAEALAGRDAVVHLAGEDVAQRWTDDAKRRIRESRVLGTRNLVAGIRALPEADRPRVLVSGSASGYYGARGDEVVTEDDPPGDDFLAHVCIDWEAEARAAEDLGVRVVRVRTGVVLDREGGALAKMLPVFRAGIGGPVAGGRQAMPWIHLDDQVSLLLAPLDDDRWTGPVNASAPAPVTNREFSRELGRALRRPAFAPVPALAIRARYGEMASIVTAGVRMVPARAQSLGFTFAHPSLPEALRDALRR